MSTRSPLAPPSATNIDTVVPTSALQTKPPRRPLQWVASAAILIFAFGLVQFFVTSENFEWNVVAQYFFFPRVLQGVWTTIWLTVVCMAIAIVLGTVIAVCRMSPNLILNIPSGVFVWFFRGTPVLVQLIFWFNLSSLIPEITIAVPFGGPVLYTESTNTLISPLLAAILGLGLNEAAYMAEIVRGGLLGVDQGQSEAATALGMRKTRIFRRIVMPQAMRLIIPPSSNEFINLLKTTSLVSVITLSELLYSVQSVYAQSFQIIPLLVVASIWYLIIVSVLSVGQRFLEQRFSRGTTRSAPVTLWARFRRNIDPMRRMGAKS